MRGINQDDEANILQLYKFPSLPNMLICSTKDYATRADMQQQRHEMWTQWAPVRILDCGHWIQLEKREELFLILTSFADEEVAMLNDLCF